MSEPSERDYELARDYWEDPPPVKEPTEPDESEPDPTDTRSEFQ